MSREGDRTILPVYGPLLRILSNPELSLFSQRRRTQQSPRQAARICILCLRLGSITVRWIQKPSHGSTVMYTVPQSFHGFFLFIRYVCVAFAIIKTSNISNSKVLLSANESSHHSLQTPFASRVTSHYLSHPFSH